MRRRFFVDKFSEGHATLSGEAAHHLGHVLRAEPGQLYELSDGEHIFLSRVESVSREAVHFAVVEPVEVRPGPLDITLLVAVVKFDHLEWALEKATELGVHRIVPLAAARSDKGLVTAAGKRASRWRRILLESAQQARCLLPPVLGDLATPADAFRAAQTGLRILLSESPGAAGLRSAFERESSAGAAQTSESRQLALGVGPEGGWTDEEYAAARAAGFIEAGLGDNILRTETAVVAGLAAAHLYWDRN